MGAEKRSRSPDAAGTAAKQAKKVAGDAETEGLELAPDEFMVTVSLPEGTKLGLDVDWKDGRTLYIKKVLPGAVMEHNKDTQVQSILGGDRIIAINGQFDDPKVMLGQCKTQRKLHLLIRTTRDLGQAKGTALVPVAMSAAAAAAASRAAAAAAEVEKATEAAAEAAKAKAKEKERAERKAADAKAEVAKAAAAAEAAKVEEAKLRRDFIATLDMTGQPTLGVEVDWADGRSLYVKSVQHGGAIPEWNRTRPPDFYVVPGSRILAVNGYSDNAETMASLCRELIAAQAMVQLRIRGPPLPPTTPPQKEKAKEKEQELGSDDEKVKKEKKDKGKDKEKDKEDKKAKEEKDRKKDKKKEKKEKEKDKER